MKTKLLLILAIIALNISFVTAGNNSSKLPEGPSAATFDVTLVTLAPVTPKEATFEEENAVNTPTADLSSLAPVTPKEATFEDEITDYHYFHAPCDVHYGCSL